MVVSQDGMCNRLKDFNKGRNGAKFMFASTKKDDQTKRYSICELEHMLSFPHRHNNLVSFVCNSFVYISLWFLYLLFPIYNMCVLKF